MFRTQNRWLLLLLVLVGGGSAARADHLEGSTVTGEFREQVRVFPFEPGVTATMVAASEGEFHAEQPTTLIVYALPNGNTTEWTIGKATGPADDWHFDIQHIGAQMRLLRAATPGRNLVLVYLENTQRSWPAWRAANKNSSALIAAMVTSLRAAIPGGAPEVVLTGHSGGGSFTFGFINGFEAIPPYVTRIGFLDSDYSFGDDPAHGPKLIAWLRGHADRRLVVIAYDDRNIELNGKKVVSDTGGTYRATYRMVAAFAKEMPLTEGQVGSYASFTAPQVEMFIRSNPENKILHTMLVGEFNGFIRAMTDLRPGRRESWEKPLASLEGPRAYVGWVERPAPVLAGRVMVTTLPARPSGALGGEAFIRSLAGMDRDAREAAILRELKRGSIPEFLRGLVPITVKATDSEGREHTAVYQVMPDYLAIGSDKDFVRIPMNPHTAQAFCDAFGFVLPTTKMVDDIWQQAASKLVPQPLTQAREDPLTFLAHNRLIEDQLAGQYPGELRAGHKKDVVLGNLLQERPKRLEIYGWHFPGGEPIQPPTTVHVDWYVDYSHGIRPVLATIMVDGVDMPYAQVLRDATLHNLLSKEGPIAAPRYPPEPETFTNPLLESGPDPWVVWWKGFYYYSNTTGKNLTLRKTQDLSDLRHAETRAVWTPEPGHAWSKEIWAPELHRWGNKWYLYFAADAGSNAGHRIYVVENDHDDPMEGQWTLKGKVADATDKWAIDATTFEVRGQHYMVWSGWKGDADGEQDLFIAHMSNPWTIDSARTLIGQPTYPWEKHGDLPGRHVNVNEGPEVLVHGEKVFLVFSGSGCWTDSYALGWMEAGIGANLLDAASWKKTDQTDQTGHPLLSTDAAAGAFGPGHNGFFQSPDGKEDWIIYHANPAAGQGCGNFRSPRMQRFTWKADGTPDFGTPAPVGKPLAKPGR